MMSPERLAEISDSLERASLMKPDAEVRLALFEVRQLAALARIGMAAYQEAKGKDPAPKLPAHRHPGVSLLGDGKPELSR